MSRAPNNTLTWAGVAVLAVMLGVSGFFPVRITGQVAEEPTTAGGPTTIRRLNRAQYARSIEQIFGAGLEIPGRFAPPVRDEGLLAIGDARVSVTATGLEQYELRAREIATQVLSEDRRASVLPCAPEAPDAFDRSCARQFFTKYGRLLYRRPLTDTELDATLAVARAGAGPSSDFYTGLEKGLSRLLMSPNFIFRVETSERDPDRDGLDRLDAYSLASRISFLLWDAPPDEALLDAADSGTLQDTAGLRLHVDRMIASPRFEDGVGAFFSDMLGYEQFDGLTKDQTIFPKYSAQLAMDAEEQSLRTIVDLLVSNERDYRELFTTRKTFLNRRLGSIYKVAVGDAAFDGWMPYTFGPDENRGGLLTLAGFLMLDPTHEGQSSPTIRGKQVRELLLCQTVPAPPPDVDFSEFQDPDPTLKTTRDRLIAHQEHPTCAGCHAITDGIGLGLENYTAIGEFRTHENGSVIDASGQLDRVPFGDAIELGQVLYDNPRTASCVTQRVYEYGVGRPASRADREWLEYRGRRFADDGYVLKALMRDVATSNAFRSVSRPDDRVAARD